MLIAQAGASFYSGRGQTWVVMIVDTGAALLNLVLDYCWIFGYYGFPEWGVAGAAWATVVAHVDQGRYVPRAAAAVASIESNSARYRGMRFDWELLRRILYFGWPSGFQMLLDVTGFTVFILLVARLGTTCKRKPPAWRSASARWRSCRSTGCTWR